MARWKFRPITQISDHHGPAAYKVRLTQDGKVQPVHRFLCSDHSGILQIGVTDNFERRRKQFTDCLIRGRGHSEAKLLHILLGRPSSRRRLGPCEYEIAFLGQSTKSRAVAIESKLIRTYFLRYGEVPPLNSAIPDRYGRDADR